MITREGFTLLSAALAAMVIAMPARAENIDVLMSGLFPADTMTYIGFDSIEREDIPETAGVERKYLVVDFRPRHALAQGEQQQNVHRICMALLRSRELIRDLSARGYDMVSVAFDRHTQYDCL